jgi:hypothetical protein
MDNQALDPALCYDLLERIEKDSEGIYVSYNIEQPVITVERIDPQRSGEESLRISARFLLSVQVKGDYQA